MKLSDGTEAGYELSAPRGQRPRLRHLVERGDLLRRRCRRRHDLHLSWRRRRRSARSSKTRRPPPRWSATRRSPAQRATTWARPAPKGPRRSPPGTTEPDTRWRPSGMEFGDVSDPVVRAVRPRGDAQRGRRRRPGRRSLHADRPGEPVRAEREHLRRSGLGDDLPGSRERDDLLRGRRKGPASPVPAPSPSVERRAAPKLQELRRGGPSRTEARHILLRTPLRDGPPTRFHTRSRCAAPSSTTRPPARRRSRARRGWGRTLVAAVADVSDDDGLTRVAYSYRWLRVDGATETNIGTGSSSYELVAEDLGKRIKVRVAFVRRPRQL